MAKRDETVAEREWHELKAELLDRPRESLDLFDIERSIQEHLGAMGRELIAAAMKRADSDAPEVEIDGASWGARGITPGAYCTLFGWVTVERSVYQQAGRGRVAVPMDLRLGIVERAYTPRVARIVTRATAVMTDEEAAALLEEIGTATVSKSTISRVPRAMAARYEQRRPVIDGVASFAGIHSERGRHRPGGVGRGDGAARRRAREGARSQVRGTGASKARAAIRAAER